MRILLVGSEPEERPVHAADRLAGLLAEGWDARTIHQGDGSLRMAVREQQPSLLHFVSARVAGEAAADGVAATSPWVVTLSVDDLYCADARDLDRDLELVHAGWSQAAALHLSDDALWARARGLGCPASTPASTVPPAADPSLEVHGRSDAGDGPLRVLSAGPTAWTSGFEHAIHAIRLLLDRGIDCHHRILGDGPHLDLLTYSREDMDLEGHVDLVREASPDRWRDELRSADVYLHSAVIPGLTQEIVDAQVAALPIVASDAGELTRSSLAEGGIVVPRRDPHAIADALTTLASDPARRIEMGQAAQRNALTQFEPQAQLSRLEQLYRLVVHG